MKTPPPTLRELVQRHAVRYEIWPNDEVVRGQKLTTGFDLELHGTHADGHTRLSPGCERCVDTYHALRELATWALPNDTDLSWVEIAPFDQSLHVSPRRGPEVVLTVRIGHRWGPIRSFEESERRCLQEMRDLLATVGVQNGH